MPPVRANLYQAEFNFTVDSIPHQHRAWLKPENFAESAGQSPTNYGLLTEDNSVVTFKQFIDAYAAIWVQMYSASGVTFGSTTLYRVVQGTSVKEFLTADNTTLTPTNPNAYGPAETRTFTATSFNGNTIILRFVEPAGASIQKRAWNPTNGNPIPEDLAEYVLDRTLCPIVDLEASHALVTRNEVQRVNSALQDIRFNLS